AAPAHLFHLGALAVGAGGGSRVVGARLRPGRTAGCRAAHHAAHRAGRRRTGSPRLPAPARAPRVQLHPLRAPARGAALTRAAKSFSFPPRPSTLPAPAFMKLSIVIPCYNEAKTIRTIVDRVRASPVKDKEIIVVDDCSRDGT